MILVDKIKVVIIFTLLLIIAVMVIKTSNEIKDVEHNVLKYVISVNDNPDKIAIQLDASYYHDMVVNTQMRGAGVYRLHIYGRYDEMFDRLVELHNILNENNIQHDTLLYNY